MKLSGHEHIFLPAQRDDAPTLLLLHGTGGNEHDLVGLGDALLAGAARLSPRGNVLEHGMPRFFRRLAEGVFDLADLKRRSTELAAFVTESAGRYGLDPLRVLAVGYSNGANIAASLLLLHPGLLAGAVLFHAMVPIVPDTLPDLTGIPVFLTAGRRDTMIPPVEAERLGTLLARTGAGLTMKWVPGGHALDGEEVDAAADWIARSAI